MMRRSLTSRTFAACMRDGAILGMAVFAALGPSTPNVAATSSLRTSPSLRFVTVSGYRLAVAGSGWRHGARLRVTADAGPWMEGLQLRTTKRGRFSVGIAEVDVCGGVSFEAADTAGHNIVLHGPPLACPPAANPPDPAMTVLQGRRLQPRVARVLGLAGPGSVTLRLNQDLYLWQSGVAQPAFTPKADAAYLALMRQGQTSPRVCPEVDCAAGFFWEWSAIKTGQTAIDLAPACRQTHPECGVPDFLIRVSIF